MRWLLFTLLLASSAPAKAEGMPALVLEPWVLQLGAESPPAALMGNDTPLSLSVGEKAPHAGVLLPLEMAARWAVRLDWYRVQLKQDTDQLRSLLVKEVALRVSISSVLTNSMSRELTGCRADLTKQAKEFEAAKKVPFYRTGRFGFAMGIVSAAVMAGLGAYLLR